MSARHALIDCTDKSISKNQTMTNPALVSSPRRLIGIRIRVEFHRLRAVQTEFYMDAPPDGKVFSV
jgi:hypothetical protein